MKILRITPDYFDVLYAINPHMKVGSVDKVKAREQWRALGQVYRELGLEVIELSGQPGFPDMVFSANQSLPFVTREGKKAVLLSNMAYPERQGEVAFLEAWYQENDYEIYRLPEEFIFEGMGDQVYDAEQKFLWGGYGHRTKKEAHRAFEELTGIPVRSLCLKTPDFYHLDVCLAVLNKDTALYYPAAFDAEGLALIEQEYPNGIAVTEEEAYNFACNAHCPDQKHVILQQGSFRLEELLRKNGFIPVPVDTSEYIKSGGSVFCMKLELEAQSKLC